MKRLIEGLDSVLCAMVRRRCRKHFIELLGVALASIAGGIWMSCNGDGAPLLVLAAGLGVVRSDALREQLRVNPDDAGLATMSPVDALMAQWKSVFRLGLGILHAKSLKLAIRDRWTGERRDWEVKKSGRVTVEVMTKGESCLPESEREICSAIYVRNKNGIVRCGVDSCGRAIELPMLTAYLGVLKQGSFRTLMLSQPNLGPRWQGRVIYIDAPVSVCRGAGAGNLEKLAEVAAAGANLFDTADSLARVNERRCLARDLHDGVTQSVIAAELQIAVLERENTGTGRRRSDSVLGPVRESLRRETRRLRTQIEELRRGEQPDSLGRVMGRMLSDFETEAGIATKFDFEMNEIRVSSQLRFELLCLLREAISNVRKHSGAKHVDVHLLVGDEVHLQIQDDGRGFGFSGRYELEELEAFDRRPRSICGRVRANGGRLSLETSPGAGVRLEIALPLATVRDFEKVSVDAMVGPGKRKPPQTTGRISSIQRAS